ncbi:hypothetical protein [Streptomyces buecherae]|uniref:Uncharacterized protein n=1 Tax=Streptomyces buecherae TaxID=2763006 RepID=A0A7H8N4E3_9ACTN|nr:hypothetical protein [Streptomyces buecherae]QKW48888.1 hypothetical protein HUT08_04275 [Streptomyces buecherae]
MSLPNRWIATFDEAAGRLEIYSSAHPTPVRTWQHRESLVDAVRTLILWSWEHPDEGWRTAALWERLGSSSVLVADVDPIRIVVENRYR